MPTVDDYLDLAADTELCVALGRMLLAASRLESDLRTYLQLNDVTVRADATFGTLAKRLRSAGLLSDNGAMVLDTHRLQRNYLTHSLYDLFAARIGEGLMTREELDDVTLLTERAWILENNLNGLADIAERRIEELRTGGEPGLIFSP